MDEYTRDALLDMLDHGKELVDLAGRTDVEELLAERVPRLAVERLLEIIGEAATRVPPHVQQQMEVPWRDIIGLRNVLIHAYHRTSPTKLAGILTHDLPLMVEAIEAYLAGIKD